MFFEILGENTEITKIATGARIREIKRLRKQFGHGRWRKLKVWQTLNYLVAGYGELNYTGTKLTELARRRSR